MSVRGKRIDRRLGSARMSAKVSERALVPRRLRNTVIDFSRLNLPQDVTLVLADAFWGFCKGRVERAILLRWVQVRTFRVFAAESRLVRSLADLNSSLL